MEAPTSVFVTSPRGSLDSIPSPKGSLSRSKSAVFLRSAKKAQSIPNTMEGALFQLQTTADAPFISRLERCLIQQRAWKDIHVLDLVRGIEGNRGAAGLCFDYLVDRPLSQWTVYPLFKEEGFSETVGSLQSSFGTDNERVLLDRVKEIALRYLNRRHFLGLTPITESREWEELSESPRITPPPRNSFLDKFRVRSNSLSQDEIVGAASELCAVWVVLPADLLPDWNVEEFIQWKMEQILTGVPMMLSPVIKALKEIPSIGRVELACPATDLLEHHKTTYRLLPSELHSQLDEIRKALLKSSLQKRVKEEVIKAMMTLTAQWEIDPEDADKRLGRLVGEDITRDFIANNSCFESFQVGADKVNGLDLVPGIKAESDLSRKVMMGMHRLIRLMEPEANEDMVGAILQNSCSHAIPLHHIFASMTMGGRSPEEMKFRARCSKVFNPPFRFKLPVLAKPSDRKLASYRVTLEKGHPITTSIIHPLAVARDTDLKQLATYARTLTYTFDSEGRPHKAEVAITNFRAEAEASADEMRMIFAGLRELMQGPSGSSTSSSI